MLMTGLAHAAFSDQSQIVHIKITCCILSHAKCAGGESIKHLEIIDPGLNAVKSPRLIKYVKLDLVYLLMKHYANILLKLKKNQTGFNCHSCYGVNNNAAAGRIKESMMVLNMNKTF